MLVGKKMVLVLGLFVVVGCSKNSVKSEDDLNKPVLISPINGLIIDNPTPILVFKWKKLSFGGRRLYGGFQLSRDKNFTDLVGEDDLLSEKALDSDSVCFMQNWLPDGIYYWRIRLKTEDFASTVTDWSGAGSFELDRSEFEIGTVTDVDGTVYMTVKIGDQWWMAENLRTGHFRNGDPIEYLVYHDNDVWRYSTYDRPVMGCPGGISPVYNKLAVVDQRGLAPEGWRVATDDDWKQLEMFLGMSPEEVDKFTNVFGEARGAQGNMLRDISLDLWADTNVFATNQSGFSALPCGLITEGGSSVCSKNVAYFWAQGINTGNKVIFRKLICDEAGIRREMLDWGVGLPVRCIKE